MTYSISDAVDWVLAGIRWQEKWEQKSALVWYMKSASGEEISAVTPTADQRQALTEAIQEFIDGRCPDVAPFPVIPFDVADWWHYVWENAGKCGDYLNQLSHSYSHFAAGLMGDYQ